jgi:hypothetical protein
MRRINAAALTSVSLATRLIGGTLKPTIATNLLMFRFISAGLDICVTEPRHRRRGAAGMQLQWGVDRADRARAPAFIEASMLGAQLYERFGFHTVSVHDVKSKEMADNAEWARLPEKYPLRYRWMERPARK